jgi:NADH-quinone oxidoreductase subunit J
MNEIFYLSGVVAILSTVMAITRRNAVHALLYFIVSLLSVAVIFFILGAPFVAALEVIIYAGAIMVLFVFVIMMLNLGQQAIEQERQWLSPKTWIGPVILTLILIDELIYLLTYAKGLAGFRTVGPKQVGISFFGTYVLGVELASILLLAALIGAYHLGRRGKDVEAVKSLPPFSKSGKVEFPNETDEGESQ